MNIAKCHWGCYTRRITKKSLQCPWIVVSREFYCCIDKALWQALLDTHIIPQAKSSRLTFSSLHLVRIFLKAYCYHDLRVPRERNLSDSFGHDSRAFPFWVRRRHRTDWLTYAVGPDLVDIIKMRMCQQMALNSQECVRLTGSCHSIHGACIAISDVRQLTVMLSDVCRQDREVNSAVGRKSW